MAKRITAARITQLPELTRQFKNRVGDTRSTLGCKNRSGQ